MKKITFVIMIFLIISIVIGFVSALNSNPINDCKKECRTDKLNASSLCRTDFKECSDKCHGISKTCLDQYKQKYDSCKQECSLKSIYEKSKCSSNCLINFTLEKKSCDSKSCLSSCNSNKKFCDDEVNFRFSDCSYNCRYSVLNNPITCEDGKYNAGETFLDGCNICKCEFNSKIDCKKTLFCNFKDLTVEKNKCISNGGFYQQLCNGPYFDIVCSQDNFCQCDGNSNYSCPEGYFCIHNFTSSLTRKYQTIPGWKTLLGFELGDIGICGKKPVLNSCGDGICENKFLNNGNNPETSYNCPEDC